MTAFAALSGLAKSFLSQLIPPFLERPKVQITYQPGPFSSWGIPRQLSWAGRFELYNESGYDALKLILLLPVGGPSLPGLSLPETHLRTLERMALPPFEFRRVIDTVNLPPGVSPHDFFAPPELKAFRVALEYRNRFGRAFYTQFVHNEGAAGACSYHAWRRPRAFRKRSRPRI